MRQIKCGPLKFAVLDNKIYICQTIDSDTRVSYVVNTIGVSISAKNDMLILSSRIKRYKISNVSQILEYCNQRKLDIKYTERVF